MKGLTHFMSGIAASTFIPKVVELSTSSRIDTVEGASNSFIMLIAGFFAVLPDTMDFKLGQFFSIAEYEIDPDPINPDPQKMADKFAEAVKYAGDNKKSIRVNFFPIQLGANKWRQYNIQFGKKEIIIQFNEIVGTSQIPFEGTAPKTNRVGRAELAYELNSRPVDVDWMNRGIKWLREKIKGPDSPPGPVKPTTLDILSGTQYAFDPQSDGSLYFNWLPWHRTWSHSYVFGAMLTIPVFIIAYLLKLEYWYLYGLVGIVGFFTHITEDMTGHIGGALLWPLYPPRSEGLELFKASDPRTNFSLDYAAIVLIVWNVDRFSTQHITMPGWQFLLLFLVLPLVIYFGIVGYIKKKIKEKNAGHEEADGNEAADAALE